MDSFVCQYVYMCEFLKDIDNKNYSIAFDNS